MAFEVKIDYAPAYEMANSLTIYIKRSFSRNLDLGTDWLKQVEKRLERDFADDLAAVKELPLLEYVNILIWLCPRNRTGDGFLEWLQTLSPGQLYEFLAPYAEHPLPSDLGTQRDQLVHLLSEWNRQYFGDVSPEMEEYLEEDAKIKSSWIGNIPTPELVDRATNGITVEPSADIDAVLLIPSLHFRPLNFYDKYNRLMVIVYPVDPPQLNENEPPIALTRLTRALNDENRLRILRILAAGQRSFTEIAQLTDLTKGTVHHHVAALRAAGLLRVHQDASCSHERYTLRPDGIDRLASLLRGFLDGPAK